MMITGSYLPASIGKTCREKYQVYDTYRGERRIVASIIVYPAELDVFFYWIINLGK